MCAKWNSHPPYQCMDRANIHANAMYETVAAVVANEEHERLIPGLEPITFGTPSASGRRVWELLSNVAPKLSHAFAANELNDMATL